MAFVFNDITKKKNNIKNRKNAQTHTKTHSNNFAYCNNYNNKTICLKNKIN